MRLRTILLFFGGLAVIALIGAVLVSGRVTVTVHNTSSAGLRALCVEMSGKRANLGDVAPQASASCTMVPEHESHIVVSYREDGGASQKVLVDVYLERGSTGSVEVWVGGVGADAASHTRFEEKIWWTVPWD